MHLHLDARCLVGIGIQFQEPLQHSNARCRIVCSLVGCLGSFTLDEHFFLIGFAASRRCRCGPSPCRFTHHTRSPVPSSIPSTFIPLDSLTRRKSVVEALGEYEHDLHDRGEAHGVAV